MRPGHRRLAGGTPNRMAGGLACWSAGAGTSWLLASWLAPGVLAALQGLAVLELLGRKPKRSKLCAAQATGWTPEPGGLERWVVCTEERGSAGAHERTRWEHGWASGCTVGGRASRVEGATIRR